MEISEIMDKKSVKQFFSYFCVGGIAAIVEWLMFFLFSSLMQIEYMLATILAFLFFTSANWFLGRIMTFRNCKKYENKWWHGTYKRAAQSKPH